MRILTVPVAMFVFFTTTSILAQETNHASRAKRVAATLQQWYDEETGLWKTTSWWNAANALTALIHYSQRTGDRTYWGVIRNTFDTCKEFELDVDNPKKRKLCRNFINPWWDDEGWWVLVWMDAYDLTGEERYLEMAKTTFADMTQGWDSVCGGGVYWKKPNIGKHAITNELFLLSAIRLHQRAPGSVDGRTYLQWALDTWNWLQETGLLNDQHLVENGLDDSCQLQQNKTYFTYNQGIILSALVELSQATNDPSLLDRAKSIASAAIEKLVYPNGILKDPHEPKVTGDSAQFKGVFMRHLACLYTATGDPSFKDFILKNADAVWDLAKNPENDQIGAIWTGPFDQADAARQSSALDALNAALVVAEQNMKVLGSGDERSAQKPFRIITYNVWNGFRNDPQRSADVHDWIRQQDPDVLALQELCDYTPERLMDEAANWGHPYSALLKTSGYPVGLTSKKPIVIVERLLEGMHHGLLHCRTFDIDFFVVHLSPHEYQVRQREAKQIVFRMENLMRRRGQAVVLGDFNALSPFDAGFYQHNTRLLEAWRKADRENPHRHNLVRGQPDYSVISAFLRASLVDLGQRTTTKLSQRASVPAVTKGIRGDSDRTLEVDKELLRRIDYIFATPGLAARCQDCRAGNGSETTNLSDHYPVIAEIDRRGLRRSESIPSSKD